MVLMGDLPFRVAFEDSTQRSRKCQLFLLFDDIRILWPGNPRKIVRPPVKTL